MDRIYAIQLLTAKHRFKTYLEIGVNRGACFFRINAKRKIAVDPEFIFTPEEKAAAEEKFRFNRNCEYHNISSDAFFAISPAIIKSGALDIALIDGLHEYRQVLKDVENCLPLLQKNGIIVMHDCNPASVSAVVTYAEWEARGKTGDWNGDVWKALVHLRATHPELDIFVMKSDHGVGFIRKRPATTPLTLDVNLLAEASFEDLDQNRQHWLNLKSIQETELELGIKEKPSLPIRAIRKLFRLLELHSPV